MPYPTHEELKAAVNYDPETGVFTWRATQSRRMKVGDRAGCVKTKKYGRQYRQIYLGLHTCLEHRLAYNYMTGAYPDGSIDHINLDGTDNRWCNLRVVTQVENMHNQKLISRNKSGVCGVSALRVPGKWYADICVRGKKMNLGLHDDFFEAVCARKSAEARFEFHMNHGKRLGLASNDAQSQEAAA